MLVKNVNIIVYLLSEGAMVSLREEIAIKKAPKLFLEGAKIIAMRIFQSLTIVDVFI